MVFTPSSFENCETGNQGLHHFLINRIVAISCRFNIFLSFLQITQNIGSHFIASSTRAIECLCITLAEHMLYPRYTTILGQQLEIAKGTEKQPNTTPMCFFTFAHFGAINIIKHGIDTANIIKIPF